MPGAVAHVPELKWPHAYPVFWDVCIALSGGMLYGFRKRGWL
jgi:magnesium transporter